MFDNEISETITTRLKNDNVRFFASDNISEFITSVEKQELIKEVTRKFQEVLKALVIDVENDPNSRDTAHRLSKMYIEEVFSGRYHQRPKVTSFPNTGNHAYRGMLVERAEIKSVCAHHFQPVTGTCFIGIIPNGEVIGLSKYMRLAHWCARRGTLQEELTNQIAREIMKATKCADVAIHIRAEHGCMTNRGVMAHSALTQTTVLHGRFEQADVKKEFFDNIMMQTKE